jgi:hypothetical protein
MIRAAMGVAWISYRSFWAGKRAVVAGIFLLLPAAVVAVLAGTSSRADGTELFHGMAFHYTLWFMLYLISLIYGIAITSGEIEEGTVGYVYLGAVPRWLVVLVQVSVTSLLLTLLTGGSLLTMGLAAGLAPRGAPAEIWADVAGLTVVAGGGTSAALAFYATCGLVFRWPLAVGATVTFFWEFMVTYFPIKFAGWTLTNNLRVLMLHLVFDGRRPPWYKYIRNYEPPTYGQASMFLSVAVGVFLVAAMVASMNRSVEGKEAR